MSFNAMERSGRSKNGAACCFKDGWYVLNLRGTNKEIGEDHGRMLAEEISAYIEETKQYVWVCMGVDYDYARNDVIRLIDATLSDEIRSEMTAIAAGVNAVLDTRYDVWDIAVIKATRKNNLTYIKYHAK